MRILFLNYEYPPLGGGAAYATASILKEYADFGNLEVDLVTSSLDSGYHLEKIGENIRIHRLPIGKNQHNLTFQSQKDLLVYAWKAYFFSKKLIKMAQKENKPFDLNHSFFTVPCGFVAMVLYYQFKVPYIISLRGSDVPGFSERFSLLYHVLTPVIVSVWKRARAIVANSSRLRDLALKAYSQKDISVIPNGIDTQFFQPSTEDKNEEKFTILCASRLSKRKGFNYAIDAFSKIYRKFPDTQLVIAGGEGDAEEELKTQVKKLNLENQVVFTGLVTPNTQFLKYYNNADVFVFPSLNEGMSNNMLEAMATGLPVIMTPTGGAEELIKEEKNGYTVRFKNSDDIAEKIEKLITDKDLTRRMGLESRRIAEGMSWGSAARKYYDLYEEVCGRNF